MADKLRKIEIGFDGGQVIAARVSEDALASLEKALPTAGWHTLDAEDESVEVNLAKVVFVRRAGDGTKIGF